MFKTTTHPTPGQIAIENDQDPHQVDVSKGQRWWTGNLWAIVPVISVSMISGSQY